MEQVKEKILEVLSAVLPITLVVILLQFTIIWLPMEVFIQFLIGAVMVTTGLILFLIGVEVGLLPVGEMIGSTLPKTKKLWMLVLFGFIFGFVVTVAEPDVRVLAL
ncbi:MAG: DUF1538 family protein, partial [Bacillota bacterium]